MQELRFAIRRVVNRPGATIASLITLAVSIAAAALTSSVLSATLLRPIPVAAPEKWFVVSTSPDPGSRRLEFTYPLFVEVRDAGIFDRVVAMWTPPESLLTSRNGPPARVAVGFVTYNLFSDLGVPLALGRAFGPDDDRRGAPPAAILVDSYWRRSFDASRSVIGQTITIARTPVTIVGVAAPRFRGLDLTAMPDLFVPLHTIADVAATSTNYFAEPTHISSPTAGVRIIGRLREGDGTSQVVDRLSRLSASSGLRERALGLTPINVAALAEPARSGMVRFGGLLATTVAVILFVGCGTVGLLLRVRIESRRAEFATCLALGASVARLVRGFSLEAALLSIVGGIAAVPVLWWLFAGLRRFQLPGGLAIELLGLTVDKRAIYACLGAATIAFLVITAVTSAYALTTAMAASVSMQGGTAARIPRRRTRATLVAVQVAVALVLLAGAILFMRSLLAALSLNPRIGMHRVLTSDVSLRQSGYSTAGAAAFFDELRIRLAAHPQVESIAYSVDRGGMGPMGKLVVDGQPRGFPSIVRFTAIDAQYFRSMRISITSGRDFADLDDARAARVAIVSESFARMLANGKNAVGRQITMPFRSKGQPREVASVVGVVPDVVSDVTVLEPLAMYFPLAQSQADTDRTVTIRVASDPNAVRHHVLSTVRALDSGVVLRPFLTLHERVERQMGPQRLGSAVLGGLGTIALLLTIVGTYVLADSIATLRLQEMGIRSALGATGRQLGTLILTETVRFVAVGLTVGLALAWIGASTVRAFLFQVQPLDPTTLAGVAAVIVGVTLIAAFGPALRAARLDLARVLKHD